VEELATLVGTRVEVVPCMVDRICSDRSIKRNAITVVTEPWEGSIIPLTPTERLCSVDEDCRVPLGGSAVFIPRTQAIADYRCASPHPLMMCRADRAVWRRCRRPRSVYYKEYAKRGVVASISQAGCPNTERLCL